MIGDGNIQGVIGMFEMIGTPLPGLAALLVALVELVGGLGVILGIGTPIWSLLLAAVMVVAIIAVKLPMAPNPIAAAEPMPGYELNLALLAGLLVLLFFGSGDAALEKTVRPEVLT